MKLSKVILILIGIVGIAMLSRFLWVGSDDFAGLKDAFKGPQIIKVEVRLNNLVTNLKKGMVSIGDEELPAENIIWAAGVRGSQIGESLKTELDRSGRVIVGSDLTISGHPEVFVVGDLAHAIDQKTGQIVPGVAPAAIQMGQYVANIIRQEIDRSEDAINRPAFQYCDKGTMATIGRNKAVADIKGRTFFGLFAWLLWGIVHLIPLVDYRSRISVIFSWVWSYLSFSKNARLITGNPKAKVKQVRKD